MRIHTADLATFFASMLVVLFAVSAALLSLVYRNIMLKRQSRRAFRKATERIRDTDDITDHLLQGVQGLVLTFHVAAQQIGNEHASKKLMDHALLEADALVSTGRRRFEEIAFASEADFATNTYLTALDERWDHP